MTVASTLYDRFWTPFSVMSIDKPSLEAISGPSFIRFEQMTTQNEAIGISILCTTFGKNILSTTRRKSRF